MQTARHDHRGGWGRRRYNVSTNALPVAPPDRNARVRAPRLTADPDRWLNVAGAAPPALPGRPLLLDFFTHGCVNCRNVLPDLEWLGRRWQEAGLAVVGVHSPKFAAERDPEQVRRAVAERGIRHPVLLDPDHELRRAYAVRAWPTLVLVDANGYVAATFSGEGHRDELDRAIAYLLGAPGAETPETWHLNEDAGPLRFPGKVLADVQGGRLFVADSGHRRIVVLGLGEWPAVLAVYEDGFQSPQGMALSPDGAALYVADADNHGVRRVDLATGRVETVAGTGRQRPGPLVPGPDALHTDLNAPWDVAVAPDGSGLYVAMAGAHQIARLAFATGRLSVYAGAGREARADGAGDVAAFAQPSGLAFGDGGVLYVADAESSCIRAILPGTPPRVVTLAGGDLFEFGFADSTGDTVRFQHPGGVAFDPDAKRIYVADTYNHRIRVVDPADGRTETLAGGFHAPGGVSAAEGFLYVADTYGHRLRRIDARKGAVADVSLGGLCAPDRCYPPTDPDGGNDFNVNSREAGA